MMYQNSKFGQQSQRFCGSRADTDSNLSSASSQSPQPELILLSFKPVCVVMIHQYVILHVWDLERERERSGEIKICVYHCMDTCNIYIYIYIYTYKVWDQQVQQPWRIGANIPSFWNLNPGSLTLNLKKQPDLSAKHTILGDTIMASLVQVAHPVSQYGYISGWAWYNDSKE